MAGSVVLCRNCDTYIVPGDLPHVPSNTPGECLDPDGYDGPATMQKQIEEGHKDLRDVCAEELSKASADRGIPSVDRIIREAAKSRDVRLEKAALREDFPEDYPSDKSPAPLTGGDSPYYVAHIDDPSQEEQAPYNAECTDIIEALDMNFAEGCAFKALWRMAAKRLGGGKPGTTRLYDAEKVTYYGERLVVQEKKRAWEEGE
jgi:hypothetical protein